MAHTKFGVNMPTLCRDIASNIVLNHDSNLLLCNTEVVLAMNTKSITFCHHSLKSLLW